MLPEFKLFRDVALHKSLSRAAAANGISQPAASQNIQELERRLGTELLDRSRRPLCLTEAGKLYLEFCRDVIRRADELEASLDTLRGAATGELKIASIYSLALSEMGRVREDFEEHCPGVELKVEYLRPDKVYESVVNEAADLGLVSYPEPTRQIGVIPWREERMAVALPPEHRLAGRRRLKPKDLEGQEFVAFDADLAIRRNLDRFLKDEGVEVRITMNFDNIQMVKEAVALGHGISILPDRTMQNELEQGRLKCAALDAPLVRPVGVVHRKRKKFSKAAAAFLRALPVA
jgi:DNA-binding transcriptional LysR family regulator